MSVPKKKSLEFGIKNRKSVNYNENENLLYCSKEIIIYLNIIKKMNKFNK